MIVRQGGKVPDVIRNAPYLLPGLQLYWVAFLTLSSCRGGMGDGRIPWTAVKEYCAHIGLEDEEFDYCWALLCAMDAAYIKHNSDKAKAEANKRPHGDQNHTVPPANTNRPGTRRK